MHVVVIGGVAAGPKTAARISRLCPDAQITLIERGEFLSYAGCGLPYYISGVVAEQKELISTPIGAVRDPAFFKKVKNIKVLNRTEAVKIDRVKKEVCYVDRTSGKEGCLVYDKLVLATGASPLIPPIPGAELKNVFTLQKIEDAEAMKASLREEKAKDVVIIGGGLIGLEMTEALASKGCRITVVERLPQILSMLDAEMAQQVSQYLESKGVKVKTSTTLEEIKGEKAVSSVIVNGQEIPCEFLILSVGVKPNVSLAKDAGLEIGRTGAIKVKETMQTSDPDIFAAGDCVESLDLITKRAAFVPLGSTANKQGRVAANTICGISDAFPGILGSTVCKLFDLNIGRTGITEKAAKEAGFDVVTVLSPAPDRAHYYPTAKVIKLKLIADKKTRRLLGLQGVGLGVVDKRIDVAATAITAGMTVDDVANLDLTYAPPYSAAMDNIITAADIARNKMDGLFESLTPTQVKEKRDKGGDFVLLDVRSKKEHESRHIADTQFIPLGQLRERLQEIPKEKEIITFCKISLRGYEAARILKGAGFKNVKVMDGGIVMWPYQKVEK